jgi:acetylornithine aminotransferase
LCDDNGWLMMLDEIQTGMCRSGQWFAHQHESLKGNAVPDIMTLAKALGNGVPIGACLARGEAATQFKPGNHGSTYGGNPLVCKTALTVILKKIWPALMASPKFVDRECCWLSSWIGPVLS